MQPYCIIHPQIKVDIMTLTFIHMVGFNDRFGMFNN